MIVRMWQEKCWEKNGLSSLPGVRMTLTATPQRWRC